MSPVARREQLLAAVRLSRRLSVEPPATPGAVVAFPTVVVIEGVPHDLQTTAVPGWFEEGHHVVTVHGVVDGLEITGRFDVCVDTPLAGSAATWRAQELATGAWVDLSEEIRAQLPRSMDVAAQGLVGAIRRVHLAAERSRAELLASNRGLLVSVVKRFRGVARQEAGVIEERDLMLVAEQQFLEVVDRWFTDPTTPPMRAVAFSKLVQRGVGNALRSEIARATGISVEFRDLLSWFHQHPEDRRIPADEVAYRMAFDAGVTRVMAARGLRNRAAGADVLREMLEQGEACYVAPGRDAAQISRSLRATGMFVISSRSSIAEIERARSFAGREVVNIDDDRDGRPNDGLLRVDERGHERTEMCDAVRSVIDAAGLSDLEAAVWVMRTGVLDPTGHAAELPDIAAELSLRDRAEARAALRRARRKLDALIGNVQEISNLVLEHTN